MWSLLSLSQASSLLPSQAQDECSGGKCWENGLWAGSRYSGGNKRWVKGGEMAPDGIGGSWLWGSG